MEPESSEHSIVYKVCRTLKLPEACVGSLLMYHIRNSQSSGSGSKIEFFLCCGDLEHILCLPLQRTLKSGTILIALAMEFMKDHVNMTWKLYEGRIHVPDYISIIPGLSECPDLR